VQDVQMTGGLLRRASEAVRSSRTATVLAAAGLIARAGFYLLLAYLVVRVMLTNGGPPANAAGALETVASTPLGLIPVGLAAVGFFAFGLSRLLGDSATGARPSRPASRRRCRGYSAWP